MRRPPRTSHPASDWTTEVSSAFALAGFLTVVFVAFTLLVMGPFVALDGYLNIQTPPPGWVPVLHVLDRMGQRAICLPVLVLVVLKVGREIRSWRPALVAALAVLSLNFVVGVLKLTLGRGQPGGGHPDFFIGGMAYPSGHTSNMVLVYGLVPYLLATYTPRLRRWAFVLAYVVVCFSLAMVLVSLTLTWHWFADLIAGLLIGGIVLSLTNAIDHAVPDDVFGDGVLRGLISIPRDVVNAARRSVV